MQTRLRLLLLKVGCTTVAQDECQFVLLAEPLPFRITELFKHHIPVVGLCFSVWVQAG